MKLNTMSAHGGSKRRISVSPAKSLKPAKLHPSKPVEGNDSFDDGDDSFQLGIKQADKANGNQRKLKVPKSRFGN
jgi:hypothetical protein